MIWYRVWKRSSWRATVSARTPASPPPWTRCRARSDAAVRSTLRTGTWASGLNSPMFPRDDWRNIRRWCRIVAVRMWRSPAVQSPIPPTSTMTYVFFYFFFCFFCIFMRKSWQFLCYVSCFFKLFNRDVRKHLRICWELTSTSSAVSVWESAPFRWSNYELIYASRQD